MKGSLELAGQATFCPETGHAQRGTVLFELRSSDMHAWHLIGPCWPARKEASLHVSQKCPFKTLLETESLASFSPCPGPDSIPLKCWDHETQQGLLGPWVGQQLDPSCLILSTLADVAEAAKDQVCIAHIPRPPPCPCDCVPSESRVKTQFVWCRLNGSPCPTSPMIARKRLCFTCLP